MARRRLRKTNPLRPLGTRGVIALLVVLALWVTGRAPWSSADSRTKTPPAPTTTPPPTPTTAPVPPPTPNPDAQGEKPERIPTVALSPQSLWSSPEACEAAIASVVAQPRDNILRIASWNLHWFPDARSDEPSKAGGTDVRWMACAMASLRADVIAVQEVVTHQRGRAALSRLIERLDHHTGGRFRFEGDECPDDRRQHVGFLVNEARVRMDAFRSVAELNPYGSACARRLRPGLIGRITQGTLQLDVLTVHLDSGNEGRDYEHRLQGLRRITEEFPATRATPLLALGDFNTMGCEDCDPVRSADDESADLHAIVTRGAYEAVAAKDNRPLCSEHFEGRAQLLDRAITTLPSSRVAMEAAGLCAELACQRPRTTSPALSRLSDHCPIVVSISP